MLLAAPRTFDKMSYVGAMQIVCIAHVHKENMNDHSAPHDECYMVHVSAECSEQLFNSSVVLYTLEKSGKFFRAAIRMIWYEVCHMHLPMSSNPVVC